MPSLIMSLEELLPLKRKIDKRTKDISNQVFGKLTVLFPITYSNGKKGVYWAAQCSCGNYIAVNGCLLRDGSTKSCGCLNNEVRRTQIINRNLKKANTIFNQHFDFLTPLEFVGVNENNQRIVKCKCCCGKIFTAPLNHLRNGHTKSCGCKTRQLISENKKYDLTNQKFGKLTPIKSVLLSKGEWGWECKCDCGNTVTVLTNYLISGHTKSCGCLCSQGELLINQILNKNNIVYETQKKFNNCRYSTGYFAKFDFYVNNSYLIEYDGIQHFVMGTGVYDNEDKFQKTQEYDNFKDQWCRDNNIPLIRIPYTHLKDLCLEDLLLETTQFRIV